MSDSAGLIAHNWGFAIFLLGVVGLCAFMLGLSSLLGSKAWGRAKNEPFESGMLPTGSARLRLSAKFYLVAMLFVIFDIEALFLFAWSVSVRESGWTGFVEALVFIAILLAGLVYLWRVGRSIGLPKVAASGRHRWVACRTRTVRFCCGPRLLTREGSTRQA